MHFSLAIGSIHAAYYNNAGRCSFEWIWLHFKAVFHRFTVGKSRKTNAEMQVKTPKMRFRHLETHSKLNQDLDNHTGRLFVMARRSSTGLLGSSARKQLFEFR